METEGRPRIRAWLDRIQSEQMLEAGVVYGYFRAVSKNEDLIVLGDEGEELTRFTFPRQRRDRRLCIADFFKAEESGETDVVGFHMVTVGSKISTVTQKLFEEDAYRDYLELHGLSVQLAEALAEYWHARVRDELGFGGDDNPDIGEQILHQGYRGSRYSFGYAACPDLEDRAKIVGLLKPERIGVDALGGVPAPPGAVDRRDHRSPPRGEVLRGSVILPQDEPSRHDRAVAARWDRFVRRRSS